MQRKKNTDRLFQVLRAEEENIDEVSELLQLDIDFTNTVKINGLNFTPLHLAARDGWWSAVNKIALKIQQTQPPISDRDSVQLGATVIRAVYAHQVNTVRSLLTSDFAKKSKKSVVTAWHYNDYPFDRALHVAVKKDDAESLALLLDYGYPPTEANAVDTPARLAFQLNRFSCLEEIAKRYLLAPSDFSNASERRLLSMMLQGIKLAEPGYQDEDLQEKREKVLGELLKLPEPGRLTALRAAKDKKTLLGDYLLNYEQGFFAKLFSNDIKLSAKKMEKHIDAEILALTPQRPRASTTQVYDDFDFDDAASFDEAELTEMINPTKRYSGKANAKTAAKRSSSNSSYSDSDTLKPVSLNDDAQEEVDESKDLIKITIK